MMPAKEYPIPEDLREFYKNASDPDSAWIGADVVELIERIAKAEGQLAEARAALEKDRTVLHRIVRQIDEEITGRMWLIEGRGSYEWDDDRYRQELEWAVNAIQHKIQPLRKIASDLKNCPETQEEVNRACAEPEKEPPSKPTNA